MAVVAVDTAVAVAGKAAAAAVSRAGKAAAAAAVSGAGKAAAAAAVSGAGKAAAAAAVSGAGTAAAAAVGGRQGGSSGGVGGWHRGSWHQGWYGSRYGWWWVVPGFGWYAYDEPVYPYPDPYAYTQAVPALPYWYYCPDPAGYYPYVTQCYGPWQPVPAQPPPPGYIPQPSYTPQAGGSANSTANDLNRQELNRVQAAPVNLPPPP